MFGTRIANIRKQLNLKQAEFGKMLGVGQAAVSAWEKDVADPDLDTLINIAKIGNVTLDMLINQSPVGGLVVKKVEGETIHINSHNKDTCEQCPVRRMLEEQIASQRQTIDALRDMVDLLKVQIKNPA